MLLSDSQVRVLGELATYRYLTVPQLVRLGVSPNRTYVRAVLRDMECAPLPLIRKIEYGAYGGTGRLPKFVYLTKRGAEQLAEYRQIEPETVFYPKQHGNPFRNDYFHRTATIDFQIELNRFADGKGNIPFYHAYFYKEGSNRGGGMRLQSKTKVCFERKFIIPDAVFRFNVPGWHDWLFAVEVKNGFDTKATFAQICRHIDAIGSEAIEKAFSFPKRPVRVLFVFSEYWRKMERRSAESPMREVMKRLAESRDLTDYYPFFAFSTLERLRCDFLREWFYVRKNGTIEQAQNSIFDA
jgi:hypothetical protein